MKYILTPFLLLLSISLFGQGAHIREATKLDSVYASFSYSGQNVLAVVFDRGIDYRHPDFIDANGNTRIKYIYDMVDPSGANDPNNPYGIGTIFTETDINNALSQGGTPISLDRFGHGTATAGIIGGDNSDNNFQGVAANVSFLIVKITHDPFPAFGTEAGQAGFFNPSYLPVALEFAHDKITEIGLPSVSLMNIGSIGGPTDGTSLISRKINEFVGQGHPFVCGVGDDGGADNHAAGDFSTSTTQEILVQKGEEGFLRFDLWYSENDRFSVSIERPNGMVEGPYAAPANRNSAADRNLGDIFIGHRGADVEFFEATSEVRELLIDLIGATGTYKIILEGTSIPDLGAFHASLNPSTYSNTNKFLSHVVPGYSINDYTTADSSITPGDYVAKNTWTDVNGLARGINGQGNVGEIWLGCSAGPTYDGDLGIDFVTPGEVAFAAYQPNTYYHSFAFNQIQGSNGLYGIQNAVSGAAPVATGIMALMLEANPNLTSGQLKAILQQASEADSFTGAVPNGQWGYGKLNAHTAVRIARQLAVKNEAMLSSGIKVYPNPFKDELVLDVKGGLDQIEGIGLFTLTGKQIYQQKGKPIKTSLSFPSPLPKGIYFLHIQTSQGKWVEKVVKN